MKIRIDVSVEEGVEVASLGDNAGGYRAVLSGRYDGNYAELVIWDDRITFLTPSKRCVMGWQMGLCEN